MSQTSSTQSSMTDGKEKGQTGNMIGHIRKFRDYTTDGGFLYQCTKCMSEFKTKQHCNYHAYCDKSLEKPFGCDKCDKRFISKLHADKHAMSHTGERPYVCPTCQKGFKTKFQLKTHVQVHTSKGHTQLGDSKSSKSTNKPRLRKKSKPSTAGQLKSSSQSKRISAGYASSSFSNRRKKLQFSCDGCDLKFADRSHLNRHMNSRYYLNGHVKIPSAERQKPLEGPNRPERPEELNMCVISGCGRGGKPFATSYSLSRHMRNCHPFRGLLLSPVVKVHCIEDVMACHQKVSDTQLPETTMEVEIEVEFNSEEDGFRLPHPSILYDVAPFGTTAPPIPSQAMDNAPNTINEVGKPVTSELKASMTPSLLDQQTLQFEISETDTNNIIEILNAALSQDGSGELGLEGDSYSPSKLEPTSTQALTNVGTDSGNSTSCSLPEECSSIVDEDDDTQKEIMSNTSINECSTEEMDSSQYLATVYSNSEDSDDRNQNSIVEIEAAACEKASNGHGSDDSVDDNSATKQSPESIPILLLTKPGSDFDTRDRTTCQDDDITDAQNWGNSADANVLEESSLVNNDDKGRGYEDDTQNHNACNNALDKNSIQELDISQFFLAIERDPDLQSSDKSRGNHAEDDTGASDKSRSAMAVLQPRLMNSLRSTSLLGRSAKSVINMSISGAFSVCGALNPRNWWKAKQLERPATTDSCDAAPVKKQRMASNFSAD